MINCPSWYWWCAAWVTSLSPTHHLDSSRKRSIVVRLRGLPFSASESDIADFFKGLEMGPDGVVICVNFQGLPLIRFCLVSWACSAPWSFCELHLSIAVGVASNRKVYFTEPVLCLTILLSCHDESNFPSFTAGRSTGQAYVQFATTELANKALERNRCECLRRRWPLVKLSVLVWRFENDLMMNGTGVSVSIFYVLLRV